MKASVHRANEQRKERFVRCRMTHSLMAINSVLLKSVSFHFQVQKYTMQVKVLKLLAHKLCSGCPASQKLLEKCLVSNKQTKPNKPNKPNKPTPPKLWVESFSGQRLFSVPKSCSDVEIRQQIQQHLNIKDAGSISIIRNNASHIVLFGVNEDKKIVSQFFPDDDQDFANARLVQLTTNRGLPPQIGSLTGLVSLTCRDLPVEIGMLVNLKSLSVSGFSNIPKEIGNLKRLERLCMHNSNVPSIPSEIGNLSALTALSIISLNAIRELPTSIVKLTSLKSIDIDCIELVQVPQAFVDMYDGQWLDCQRYFFLRQN
jgi:Leucine-rich repeat (LRR) protein